MQVTSSKRRLGGGTAMAWAREDVFIWSLVRPAHHTTPAAALLGRCVFYREENRWGPAGSSKMAPEHAASLIPSPQLPFPSLPPPTSPSCSDSQDRHSDVDMVLGDKDLCSHILSLPTKAGPELFANRVEKALWQEKEVLQADTAHIVEKVKGVVNPKKTCKTKT